MAKSPVVLTQAVTTTACPLEAFPRLVQQVVPSVSFVYTEEASDFTGVKFFEFVLAIETLPIAINTTNENNKFFINLSFNRLNAVLRCRRKH